MNYRINPHNQNPEDADKNIVSQNETIGRISKCPPILKERYQVIKPLSESIWNHTFLAIDQDKPSKPPCIIKEFVNLDHRKDIVFQGQEVIPTFLSCDPVQLDKIGKHPQLPELLASVEHDGHRYLVQEYIQGSNLATELIQHGVFSESRIWQVLNQLLPVLEFIHNHDLIHGDIKPENIICRTKQRTNTQEFVLENAMNFLELLEKKLEKNIFLFGSNRGFADIGIAPFIRQFAHVDIEWFLSLKYPKLINWYKEFVDWHVFKSIMEKNPKWADNLPIVFFP